MAQKNEGVNVQVGLDAKSFNKEMSNVNRSLKVLDSEFKKSKAEMGGFEKGMDQMKLKSQSLTKKLETQKDKVNLLSDQYQKLKKTKGEDNTETEKMLIKLNNAKTAQAKMQKELKKTNDTIKTQESRWTNLSTKLDKVGTKFKSVGTKMSSIGKSLATKVTLPLVGVAAASSKVGIDFESAMSEVQAISGATGKDLEDMKSKAEEMGKKTSKSATDSANALKFMSLAGWDAKDSMQGLEPVLRLSEAGNMDLGYASDMVTDSMSALGLEVGDLQGYLDSMAQTSRKSNTDIGMLGEAFIGCGGTLKNLKVPLDEGNTLLGVMANKGIKGSEAGNKLNSVLINLTKGSGESGKAMEELGLSAYDSEGNFKGVTVVLQELQDKLKNCTDKQKQQYLAMIGGKTQIDTLNALLNGLGTEYDDLRGNIKNCDGSLMDMATTMQDNTKGSITKLKSALEGAGIVIFEKLQPSIKKVTETVNKLVDKFSNLDEKSQDNIIKIGLIAAAIPPLLIVIGKVVKIAGGLVTAMSAVSTGIGVATGAITGATGAGAALGTVFTVLSGPIGLVVAAIAGLTVAGVALYNHLKKDCIPEVDLFGDGVSEATRKAVGGYMDLDDKATKSLMHLKFSSETVSEEMSTNLVSTFNTMGEQIKQGIDTKFSESYNTIQNFFTDASSLTEEEENSILEKMKTKNEEKKAETDNYVARINEIMTKAKEDKRALTSQEQQEINSIQEEMKVTAVNVLSENELEAKAIMERMKQQAEILTTRQCADVVKNSLEQKDKAVENANTQYDETIKAIIKQRDEAGTITAEQADKLIEEATRQRDETVNKATETHNKVIEQAKLQSGEHVKEVDWETGEIKSKWQRLKDNAVEKYGEIKTTIINTWEDVKTDAAKKWDIMVKGVGEWIDNIIKTIKDTYNNVKKAGADMINSVWEGMKGIWNDVSGWVSDKVSWLVDKLAFWKKSKSDINKSKKEIDGISVENNYTGTNDFKGGLTYVSEKGKELIETPEGKSFVAENKTLMNLPEHTKIYTNAQTRRILNGKEYKNSNNKNSLIDYNKLADVIVSNLNKFKNGVTQNLTINSTRPLSPIETARKNKQALQDFALQIN